MNHTVQDQDGGCRETAIDKGQINPNLEDFKSLYYLLNAKPDTQLKVFKEPKRVEFKDIVILNDKITAKVNTHNILFQMSSINIMFKDGSIKEYSAWQEFLRLDTASPLVTDSISITWDLSIILPSYKLPQRHTLKIRIGTDMKPVEQFHLMVLNDNDADLEENTAFLVVKVDFINSVISNELIQNVVEWYNCLKTIDDFGWFQKFINKHNYSVTRFLHQMVPILLFSALYLSFKYNYLSKEFVFNCDFLTGLYYWFIMIFVAHYLGQFVGGVFGSYMYGKIMTLNDDKIFLITAGDNNAIQKGLRNNKRISREVAIQILVMIIGAIMSAVIAKYI